MTTYYNVQQFSSQAQSLQDQKYNPSPARSSPGTSAGMGRQPASPLKTSTKKTPSPPSSWASYSYIKDKIKECEFTMAKTSAECGEDDVRYRRLEMEYARLKLQLAEAQSEDDWKEFVNDNQSQAKEEEKQEEALPKTIQRRLKGRRIQWGKLLKRGRFNHSAE
mmetsp:Transcript_11887/g.14846  ORF Transcript_11887/g.14846 Transcript_11887/m.14846 type:complete len:164 (-) Transcript_11887:111-602(-)|eukprot:CAMPEP_0172488202 /NCGR_PEP_ID=MMETSP1066-20121228/17621_1 /TAXON_ID=671091 /ORGANISM="Coscinodiscus wailesii, Strain CCMP2513" /LENGTH=163 /DNA_ID=CAMNT_0013255279 /DNA_START=171 /DNA_END=662 /DNA_ORIENTATION=+